MRRDGSLHIRSRLAYLLLAFLAVALLAGVIVAVSRGGDAPPTTEEIEARALRTLAGVPQNGALLGDPAAPATLSIYTELTAFPFGDFVAEGLPVVVERYVRPGRLKLRLSPLPGGEDELDEVPVARLANSIALQDRLWQFASVFSTRYLGFVDRFEIEQMVRRSGANLPVAVAALDTPLVTAALAEDQQRIRRYRTRPSPQPLYIVDPPIGAPREVRLPTEAEGLVATMDRLLRQ